MSLVLREVHKRFATSDGREFAAVDGISLTLAAGEFHTLLGPSGCGKTTLLRMIAGFESPSSGEILHRGRPLGQVPPHRRGFPMVFQSYALFPHLSVARNVGYGLKLKKVAAAQIAERVARVLKLLDLTGQGEKHPYQLSGGQQQRVALARALVLEPEIILFDEPLSNLDAKLRLSMRDEIRALQRKLGITAVYVTHDQEEAMAISDRVHVLNQGRIEQSGPPTEVFARPRTEFVARFLGCPNILPIERLDSRRVRVLEQAYDVAAGVSADAPEGKVLLRPDAFRLSREQGRHRATVKTSTFLGSRFQYLLDCSGAELSVELPSHELGAIGAGEVLHFDLLPERLHFL